MKRYFSFFLIIFLFLKAGAQSPPDSLVENVETLADVKSIVPKTFVFIDSSLHVPLNKVLGQMFVPLSSIQKWDPIPKRLITKPVYLSFTLKNASGSPLPVYYYPGTLYDKLEVYKVGNRQEFQRLPGNGDRHGYLRLVLNAGEQSTYLVKGIFCRTPLNNIESRILTPAFLPFYTMYTEKVLITKKVVGILFSGALFMMIVFTLVNFFLNRKTEFIYFCLYSTCMFFLIFFTSYLAKDAGEFKSFFLGYLDLLLLMAGTIFYLAFTRTFLNTKSLHPGLDKFLAIEQWIVIGLTLAFTYMHYGTDDFVLENRLENLMKIFVMLAAVVFVIIAFLKNEQLMNYLATGTAIQLFFYSISLFLINRQKFTDGVLSSSIFYFEVGVVAAVIFFLLGITYKNMQELITKIKEQEAMKLEAEKKGFETQLAVINAQQEERNRISADMHDDLGSGMTAIRLYSELARSRTREFVIPEIDKISNFANELLVKMNAIIWSMSSSNDTLGNTVAYIRAYAKEYLEDSNIEAIITLPAHLPEIQVEGAIRRNIFLVVKEALHNIVKHAEATIVEITLIQLDKAYSLEIKDNGKGIDINNIREFGNGLKNMKKRMDDVDITFEIENNRGTIIKLYRVVKG